MEHTEHDRRYLESWMHRLRTVGVLNRLVPERAAALIQGIFERELLSTAAVPDVEEHPFGSPAAPAAAKNGSIPEVVHTAEENASASGAAAPQVAASEIAAPQIAASEVAAPQAAAPQVAASGVGQSAPEDVFRHILVATAEYLTGERCNDGSE